MDKQEFKIIKDGAKYSVPIYTAHHGKLQRVEGSAYINIVRGPGPDDDSTLNHTGTLHEHLLAAIAHDLKQKWGVVESDHTLNAINHVEAALHSLVRRSDERKEAGVQGTYARLGAAGAEESDTVKWKVMGPSRNWEIMDIIKWGFKGNLPDSYGRDKDMCIAVDEDGPAYLLRQEDDRPTHNEDGEPMGQFPENHYDGEVLDTWDMGKDGLDVLEGILKAAGIEYQG